MSAPQARLLSLKNNDIEVTFTNYGARITSLLTPDNHGEPTDVVAGFATPEDYQNAKSPYYGATIGRFANRIAGGHIEIEGKLYQLPINNGKNSLHGGSGFHSKIWDVTEETDSSISMQYHSPDGEDGYPGNMVVKVTFTLEGPAIKIDYEATTDQTTVVNLTNHAYFNLNGEGSGSIEGHHIYINADAFIPVNENLIPFGEIKSVEGTPFDFKTEQRIGDRIDNNDVQLSTCKGYDHTYVLNRTGQNLSMAARLRGDVSGITMDVLTTEPGMQFYSGNFMNGSNTFKGGATDDMRTTLALETQHFPDSPNQPNFPSTLLQPGEIFQSATVYKFGLA